MKILTLNTHSLVEENYRQKTEAFVSAIAKEKPEIIALQEVNQSLSYAVAGDLADSYTPCCDKAVRCDNHAFRVVELLKNKGVKYYWSWLPLKKGYDRFEEGIAVLSLSPIIETEIVPVSNINDYNNWKTRKIIGVRTKALPDEWFYSVHYGWWDDEEEPFYNQWHKTKEVVCKKDLVWLMGDFNNSPQVRGEGYDLVRNSYWYDSFDLAETKEGENTVNGAIDGWRHKDIKGGMRLDYIWCSKSVVVTNYKVVFDGKNYPVVSDHYGVMINYERSII